jgi:hypothetical protein
MSLEKIENSLKKCPDLPEIKILGWQLCNITDFIQYLLLHFYFRVQVPLKYPCEILFWLSRMKINLFSPWYRWKIAEFFSIKLQSLTGFWISKIFFKMSKNKDKKNWVIYEFCYPYKALLYNSNIFYCIQYDKELTILPKTIAQILELKNGDFQINLVSIQEPLYYNESLCTCVDHFIKGYFRGTWTLK